MKNEKLDYHEGKIYQMLTHILFTIPLYLLWKKGYYEYFVLLIVVVFISLLAHNSSENMTLKRIDIFTATLSQLLAMYLIASNWDNSSELNVLIVPMVITFIVSIVILKAAISLPNEDYDEIHGAWHLSISFFFSLITIFLPRKSLI